MDRLRAIIGEKQRLLEKDEGWSNYSEDQTAAALAKLENLDDDFLTSDFSGADAKLLALKLLLLDDDSPNFADDFKNRLFQVLRKFTQ